MDDLKEYGYEKITVFDHESYIKYIKNDIEAVGYIYDDYIYKIHMMRNTRNGRKFFFPVESAMNILKGSDNFDMLTLKAEQVILKNQFMNAFGKV